jgi:exo-1,4-beta-D-glucosaminidase
VTVENPSPHLAFSLHLRLLKGSGGKEVVPILWEDNYFELMPGEKREITATYRRSLLGGASPVIQAEGWNIAPTSAHVARHFPREKADNRKEALRVKASTR